MKVKIEEGKYYRTQDGRKVGPAKSVPPGGPFGDHIWAMWRSGGCIFEIVGVHREDAFHTELVSEWDDTPKLWRDMTDEEKGALLLARHEGKAIEVYESGEWTKPLNTIWYDWHAYRVKPEPVRKVVELFWRTGNPAFLVKSDSDTHRITFETVDGKPDCSTIKMEEIVG